MAESFSGASEASSSGSGSSSATRRPSEGHCRKGSGRVRTRCKVCAARRVKCEYDDGEDDPRRRAACSNCRRRRNRCQYPDGRGGWLDALDQDGASFVAVGEATLTRIGTSTGSGPGIARQPTSSTASASASTPTSSSAVSRSDSAVSMSESPASAPPSTTSNTSLAVYGAMFQPQLSPRSRISLFDAAMADDSDRLLLAYLFANRINSLSVYGHDPQKDHFQRAMVPWIYQNLAGAELGMNAESTFVYHSALAFSAFHSALFTKNNVLEQAVQHTQKAQNSLELIRTSLGDAKSESSLIGLTLLNLAHTFGGLQFSVQPDDLSAILSTALGHEIYDILCVYSTLVALAQGRSTMHAVPAAGSRELEATFGVARPIWHLYSRLTALLARTRQPNSIARIIDFSNLEQESAQLLQHSADVLVTVENTRSSRVLLGSKAMYHTLAILLQIEVLGKPAGNPELQQHCELVLQTCLQVDRKERSVGLTLPLTIAACYSSNATQRMQMIELLQIVQVVQESESAGPTIPELCLALAGAAETANVIIMPWREAMQISQVSLLL